jgi:hypothetical protein
MNPRGTIPSIRGGVLGGGVRFGHPFAPPCSRQANSRWKIDKFNLAANGFSVSFRILPRHESATAIVKFGVLLTTIRCSRKTANLGMIELSLSLHRTP